MTSTTAKNTETRTGFFSRYVSALGKGLMAVAERDSRMQKIRALQALSDAELAEMGLERDDIARYVMPGYL